MQRRRWTDDERAEALRLLVEHGPAEVARRTGIPAGTVASWSTRAGVSGRHHTAATVVATEARVATIAERKAALAEGLLDDVARLRRDLFAGTLERKVVPGTQHRSTEIVDVSNKTTTATERRTTVEAIAKALETVQLLTGEATSRVEQLGGPRLRAEQLVDDLERRRQAKAS